MAGLTLEGVRVLDLTMNWAGPHGAELLADLGAEVIKIERPRGDPVRGPRNVVQGAGAYAGSAPGRRPYNRAAVFNQLHRNKYGISLDLTTLEGKTIFKELVKISDAVVENFSAEVMDRLGLGYERLKEVKPDIVMAAMPGLGKTGPQKDFLAYGVVLEPHTGILGLTGYYQEETPVRSGVDHMDPLAGTHAAGAILAALLYCRRTGKGQFMDVSHMEGAVNFIGEAILDYLLNKRVWEHRGNRHSVFAPHGCYRCRGEDRWVTISVSSEEEWQALCRVLGNPLWTQDPRFADSLSRWQHQEELDKLIESWTSQRDHYVVMHLLQKVGVAAGAVLDVKELAEDPHLRERSFFEKVSHPEVGEYPYIGPRGRFSRTPGQIRQPAPCFGEHNHYIFGKLLGLSEGEIVRLGEQKVLYAVPV